MLAQSPKSPEARRHARHEENAALSVGRLGAREVIKRVAIGVYSDGVIHAGNLAYLTLVALFPFFIVAAAIAQLFGRSSEGIHTLEAFLHTVPPDVATLLRKPVSDVLMARTGNLLWFGAIVGLWTVAGFIETIRGILRQAYGTPSRTPFWRYRLGAIGMIIASVIITMAAFSFQVILTGVEQFLYNIFPWASEAQRIVSLTKIAPAIALFGALYILFYSLTPSRYRKSKCPKWPGALFTAVWWLLVTALLPKILGTLGSYDLTYGSLAGVMIALIFFFFVGLGLVVGAELNAALAESDDDGVEDLGGSNKQEAAAA
jgi:membrane protein